MPKRWSPLRAFAWGACLGALFICFELIGRWGTEPLIYQIGGVLGAAFACGLIFALAAFARNFAVTRISR